MTLVSSYFSVLEVSVLPPVGQLLDRDQESLFYDVSHFNVKLKGYSSNLMLIESSRSSDILTFRL